LSVKASNSGLNGGKLDLLGSMCCYGNKFDVTMETKDD